jgi:hypothetical protein
MKKQATLSFLYCTNKHCQFSIHQLMVEVRIPSSAENEDVAQRCVCCNQPLSSEMDAESQHLITETKSKLLNIPNYN